MKYTIVLSKKVQKDLEVIGKQYTKRILETLEGLSYNPFLGKKLEGEYRDCYSYRVWPYRIVYSIDRGKLLILIIRIGHRQGVYK